MSDPRDKWTNSHFSQSNPDGPGQGEVPALLRRVADSIEELGDVMVEDITFSSEVTADERDVPMTVYYHRWLGEWGCRRGGLPQSVLSWGRLTTPNQDTSPRSAARPAVSALASGIPGGLP